ncbi:hypothetical protein PC9H_001588 [Pleurotus ostreatus]|uniref:DUF6699 domain-containing protein n=1 Tax=Pleurotus ostreatus TaxID=5322 RepID=A0A8H7A6D8_PLEOS|nr:uncharacterized protein PC9H_001588 [Pleurotus ostreatus]KAF7441239.1 hypothetical protein PC9H_001588 [Pleurotus ostreatus]KAJ8699249.1 hypothetical protein PTI98_002381 [Pleurotus ostreatus]
MSRRPTPNVTPFIPPLNTPEAPPSAAPPPVPSPGGPLAGWASLPQNPNNYPPFYPSTPYTTTPFVPSLGMSAHGTPVIPMGSYTPAAPPSAAIPPMQPGLSADYIGYPSMGPTPAWGPPAPLPGGPPPGTPWSAPATAFQQPPGTPWGGMAPQGYQPFHQQQPQHQSMAAAFPGMMSGPPPPQMQQPPMARPQAAATWGMPPQGMPGGYAHTPAMGMGMLDPWGAPPPPAPAWAQPPPPGPLRRATDHDGDHVNPFTVGDHYGPVLEPFLIQVVKASVKLNPLIEPAPDNSDRPYLKWNMLFPSAYTQRSTDPSTMSWINGREEPATFPRITFLRLISKSFPWMITVRATKRTVGVTCGEVIDAIAENMSRLASQTDYHSLPKSKQKTISENYRRNRSRAHGVPGGRLGEGIKRLDWLGTDSMFGGIERNERLVKEICGDVLPCTFSVSCIRRYPMSEQEIKDHEARERTMREHNRSLQPSAATPSIRTSVHSGGSSDDSDD